MSTLATWTVPYHGVQHYGSFSTCNFWATVQDYGSFAEAFIWVPGCGFSPMASEHDNVQAARDHTETQLHVLTRGRMGKPCIQGGAE